MLKYSLRDGQKIMLRTIIDFTQSEWTRPPKICSLYQTFKITHFLSVFMFSLSMNKSCTDLFSESLLCTFFLFWRFFTNVHWILLSKETASGYMFVLFIINCSSSDFLMYLQVSAVIWRYIEHLMLKFSPFSHIGIVENYGAFMFNYNEIWSCILRLISYYCLLWPHRNVFECTQWSWERQLQSLIRNLYCIIRNLKSI
jgi:hypothetical protein